jgi:primosomal protein N' (replication factor Y)
MFAEVVLPLPIDKPFHYGVPAAFADTLKPGMRVLVPFGKKRLIGYCADLVEQADVKNVKDILELIDAEPMLPADLFALGVWLSKTYLCSLGESLGAIFPGVLRAPKRAIKETAAVAERAPQFGPALTQQQDAIVRTVKESMAARTSDAFLLHGVTGSGKTEVYLALIDETIRRGRSAVFLLPEIALTPQFIHIVTSRFPGLVGLWHSRISAGEKYRTWDAARQGKIRIMLGARSAIFAPFADLGLVIVDEEHEPSYKQEQKPGYQTREVVIERARLAKAVAVFGSATPSFELYHRAKTGGVKLLELTERIADRALPPVKLVNIAGIRGPSKILSETLLQVLTRVLARREQSILFLNRRGYAPGVVCRECGAVIQCPHCSISLVYHQSPEELRCHYCDMRRPWSNICPTCKKGTLDVYGAGTQKVEEELKRLLPQARVFRLDRDTASRKGVYEKVYNDFKKEEFDILLGTQMVVKGFDFQRVTLVGVIDADTALYLPDFRSAERTFQLITQVAGRCGRGTLGGEVIVQTRHPEHYALQTAREHDYRKFYAQEIELRRQMGYPPYVSLVNVLVRGRDNEKTGDAATGLARFLGEQLEYSGKIEVLGPTPAAREKLQGFYRWQLLLKGDPAVLNEAAGRFKDGLLPSGVLLSIDVDPQSTL